VSVLERIRRLFGSRPDPDHPLSEEEREGVPETTADEASSLIDEFAGAPFDPDADDGPRP
jgi:hypothetical protein